MDTDWHARARVLEREGHLAAAEALVADAIPDAHYALAIAQLYLERCVRLRDSDRAAALEAHAAAERWAHAFAAQATSGSEGLAYGEARDAFLATLPRLDG